MLPVYIYCTGRRAYDRNVLVRATENPLDYKQNHKHSQGPRQANRTAHIKHQCRKTTVLSCLICLINTGVEKMNYI